MAAPAPKNTTSAALASLADALAILAGEEPGQGDGEGGAQPADDAAPGTGDPGAGDSDEDGEGEGECLGIPSESLGGERDMRGKAKAGFGSGSHKKSRLHEEIKAIIRDETDPKPTKGSPAPIGLDICPDYKIYSTKGDLVIKAEDLLPATKRTRLRDELDSLMSDSSLVSRLATKLMRHIMAQQTRAWQFDQEDGLLDPARLARLISAPMLPAAYKTETIGKFKETTVTLLVDNSGSMSGTKIQIAAVVADTLARVMERCGVPVEVLGFTSKGYASLRGVSALGSGAGIGRFSCLRHIIYKAATVPYRRVRENFAVMLHDETLSQNVDGEALAWAHNRLVTRSQPRKILIMISDGAPAAEYDNGERSHERELGLVRHLRAVIGEIEKRGEVELLAIGLGHDVTTWFKHGVTLHEMEDVGPALLSELGRMFEPKRPGR